MCYFSQNNILNCKPMNAVDTYIAALDEPRSFSLEQLRKIILETVPAAEETVQYNMPACIYHGMLCAFASQKNYHFQNQQFLPKNTVHFARYLRSIFGI